MYDHLKNEKKWQKIWKETNAFETKNSADKKYYVLDMFPYPSGSGLHVGHLEGYTASDIIARYKRLNGYDVLHPIGWDAFGLPAEQYALKTGNHPQSFTLKNISNFKKQLQKLGFSYDFNKEINTTDPKFYKQTQWIFTKLYEHNLASLENIDVNWCPELGTVLANEEILTNEKGQKVSERGNFLVYKKPMKQWVLKITKFANELYDDLNNLKWPNSLKNLQKNWIKNKDGSLHLKDWIFSRQRYWGEPFPILFDENNQIHIFKKLPLILPKMDKIEISNNGQSPLFNNKKWLNVNINEKNFKRETNTMPQWAGSSWYYLAYILKNSDGSYEKITSKEAQKRFLKWLPIDLYIGGQEHAVLHLLYARFWHKFLYKIGVVPVKEPFFKVVNQGMILGNDGQKMSKSKGNVINPDELIETYGADALRLYEMFMGPIEDTKNWSNKNLFSMRKWINRIDNILSKVNFVSNFNPSYFDIFIKESTENIENMKFNIVISKMMVYINHLIKDQKASQKHIESFLIILSCFAPHFAEAKLEKFGFKSILNQNWPKFNQQNILEKETKIIVQINGKFKYVFVCEKDLDEKNVIKLIYQKKYIHDILITKKIDKIIFISNKLINFVVSDHDSN